MAEFSSEVALSVLTWVTWYVLVYVAKAQGSSGTEHHWNVLACPYVAIMWEAFSRAEQEQAN